MNNRRWKTGHAIATMRLPNSARPLRVAVVVLCCWTASAVAYQQPNQPARPQWFLAVQVTAMQEYRLGIYKRVGKEDRLLLACTLKDAHATEMKGIVATIITQFDLPPLDEKGRVVAPEPPATQVGFRIIQLTKNRRQEIRFGQAEVEQLKLRAAIDKLIAIVNEQIGPKSEDADLREFQQVLQIGAKPTTAKTKKEQEN